MIPIIPTPIYQPQNNAAVSFYTSASSNVPAGQISAQSITANVAAAEAQNQSRGNGQSRSNASASANTASSSNPFGLLSGAAPTSAAPSSGFSSLFLAQLFGQGSALDGFSVGASTDSILNSETIAAYSRVKYAPSYASVPRPESSSPNIEQPAQTAPQPSRQQLIATALLEQAPQTVQPSTNVLTTQTNATTNSGFAAVLSAAPVLKTIVQKPASTPVSLIRTQQGASSYEATATRNSFNLVENGSAKYSLSL